MAAFKKSFLVLAAVVLALAGASGTAYAQAHPTGGLITCFSTSAPPLVRAEGLTELEGDIVLSCTAASTLNFGSNVVTNFNVTLNTNVTSRNIGGGFRDAVLVVNENTTTAGSPFTTSVTNANNIPAPQFGAAVGNNGLAWNGVNLPVPGFGKAAGVCLGSGGDPNTSSPTTNPCVTQVRITNIRANVAALGIPSGDATFPSTQVVAFLSVTGPTNLSVSNNVLNIGIPLLGLTLRFRGQQQFDADPNDPTTRIPLIAQQCLTQCINSDGTFNDNCLADHTSGNGPANIQGNAVFTVRLSEGFATAFKTLGVPTDFPGNTQVEDGFCTGGPCSSNGRTDGANGGGADDGTRFILKFFNVPAGVRVFTPLKIVGSGRLKITKLAGTDANGAGGSLGTATKEVSIVNGFGFAVYLVEDDNPFAPESVVIPVVAGFTANTPNDRPAIGTMSMSVNFAALSTVGTASDTAWIPRFVENNSPRSVFGVSRCITNLLFPFVTNNAGFDTGFAISNTSADDKGTVNQAGTCTLFYFGSTTGGGAAPSPQTSVVVAAGKQIVWTLSGGNAAANVTGTPGFQGYLFAQCQFQYAHGFAFITDGFGGVPAIAEGYLALVVPWNGVANTRAAGNGETLGH